MSTLIPEQRPDKNGKLVTRHVRVSKESATVKNIPQPKIAKRKVTGLQFTPTKQQSREHFYMFSDEIMSPVDGELLTALGIDPSARRGVRASEFQMYDLLAVTDRGTAIALLEAGVRSSPKAKEILVTLGKENLLQDNSESATEALRRGIISHSYISKATPEEMENPHFLDYVEALNIGSLSQYTNMHASVREGLINISDIKAITPSRITMTDNWFTIKAALVKLADGTANYTVQEINNILDRYARSSVAVDSTLRQAFSLADRYGSEFAIEMTPTDTTMNFSNYLMDHDIDVERSKSLLRYNQQVVSSFSGFGSGRPKPRHEDIIAFHDAGANPDHVANGSITLTQLDAITNHGIAPSVSGGWL